MNKIVLLYIFGLLNLLPVLPLSAGNPSTIGTFILEGDADGELVPVTTVTLGADGKPIEKRSYTRIISWKKIKQFINLVAEFQHNPNTEFSPREAHSITNDLLRHNLMDKDQLDSMLKAQQEYFNTTQYRNSIAAASLSSSSNNPTYMTDQTFLDLCDILESLKKSWQESFGEPLRKLHSILSAQLENISRT